MKKIIITTIIALLFIPQSAKTQVVGTPYLMPYTQSDPNLCTAPFTKGTDFWLSFGKNEGEEDTNNVFLALKIAAGSIAANVTLTFTADTLNKTVTYSIAANSMITIDLSKVTIGTSTIDKRSSVYIDAYAETSGKSNKTLRITSTQLVSVYAFNTSVATTDATIILPVTAWGTEYYRLSYLPDLFNPDYDFEMIIAKEDDTTITFPDSSTATLNTGQVYYRLWKNDMTGRHVTSNKPTAYFTHSTLSRIFVDRNYGDILFEQMVPVNQWGKEFLVPNAPQNSNTENNHIRILAAEDGTTVSYSGATLITGIGSAASFSASGNTLNKGQWVELRINSISGVGSGSCFINAGKPIGVAAYMTGQGVQIPGYGGDPSIAWIPPLNQASPNVTISPFMFPQNATPSTPPTNLDEPSAQHYMIIITKTTTRTSTTVNGTAINSGWTDVSGYSYYRQIFNNIADLNAVFNVANPSGVIVLCGGISDRESYYYNAGSGACIIN